MKKEGQTKERLEELIQEVVELSDFIVLSDKVLHKRLKKIEKTIKKKGVKAILEEGTELDRENL